MRTFEEAMALRQARNRKEMIEKGESIERYDSMIREIGESQSARSFVVAMIHMFDESPEEISEMDALLSVVMSAFVNGVMVGIEMERQDVDAL